MSGGKTTAFGLPRRLAKLLAEFLGVGHGEAGAVEDKDAVAEPTAGAVDGTAAGAEDSLLQTGEEGDGEAGAGLTVGGVGKVEAGEVAEVADGGVAVQNLLEEEVGGDDGGKGAF